MLINLRFRYFNKCFTFRSIMKWQESFMRKSKLLNYWTIFMQTNWKKYTVLPTSREKKVTAELTTDLFLVAFSRRKYISMLINSSSFSFLSFRRNTPSWTSGTCPWCTNTHSRQGQRSTGTAAVLQSTLLHTFTKKEGIRASSSTNCYGELFLLARRRVALHGFGKKNGWVKTIYFANKCINEIFRHHSSRRIGDVDG